MKRTYIVPSWHDRDHMQPVELRPYAYHELWSDVTRIRRTRLLTGRCWQCGKLIIPGRKSLGNTHHAKHFWQIYDGFLWP